MGKRTCRGSVFETTIVSGRTGGPEISPLIFFSKTKTSSSSILNSTTRSYPCPKMKSSSGSSVRRVGLMLAVASISCSTAAPVSKFTSLDSCGAIDISVQAGSDYDVTIEGSPEYVKYAGATVKDGTLYIQNEAFSPAKGSMSVVAVVTVPKDALTSITSFGSGDIAASGLSASTFSVTSQGSGDVTIDAAVSGALDVSSNG